MSDEHSRGANKGSMTGGRGITTYALSRGTDLAYPSAYRLSCPGGAFPRLHAETLDRLCQFFQVQPGKLIQWVPSVRRRLAAPPDALEG